MKARWTFLLAATSAAAVCAPAVMAPRPALVWNTTASAPTGLYIVRRFGQLQVGQLVAVNPPDRWRAWLDQGGYLPGGVPLVKTIAAVTGQRVCRNGGSITVDHRLVVRARVRDRQGRPLPVWKGCHRLSADELFLLNPAAPDSLDGRYLGLSLRADVIGELLPIWTREG